MKTIRELIEDFIYEHLQYHISMVNEHGDDTVFEGIRVMDDPTKFVYGMLVNTTTSLYLYYLKNKDERAEQTLTILKKFIKNATTIPLKTWGKLSVLRAFDKLQREGLMHIVADEDIELLKERTNYEDFLVKSELRLIGCPTNYLHVAMGCAGLRERLGWDTDAFSEIIKNKLISIMQDGSDTGYMDEEPPMARFDRYSILVSSELADTMADIGLSVPDFVLKNLANAAKTSIGMANERGDGINYGRSISCHGDGATLELFASAFACGLIDEEDKDTVLLYCIRIIEKMFNFWYDQELRSFNIWWKGRTTNEYRLEHRVLEVNLDMAVHMLTTLQNFEIAGLADTLPNIEKLPSPKNWSAMEFIFIERPEQAARTIVLRHRDDMLMLPLIGIGERYMQSAYLPYPNLCGVLEAAPEAKYPFLIPNYTMSDGTNYRPIQFFTHIETREENEGVSIHAKGHLARIGEHHPQSSEYGFEVSYRFEGNEIHAEFNTDLNGSAAQMLVGWHDENFTIEVTGFDGSIDEAVDDVYDFKTPAGAFSKATTYTATNAKKLTYTITLADRPVATY